MRRRFTIILSLLFIVGLLQGQTDYQLGVFLGMSNYIGDLAAEPQLSESGFSVGLMGSSNISRKFNLRANLLYNEIQGSDFNFPENEERINRGFSFESTIVELSATVEWEPFGRNRYQSNAAGRIQFSTIISPFLYLGGGLSFASTDPDFSNSPQSGNSGIVIDTQGGDTFTNFTIPFGAGVKFDVTEKVLFGLEIGGRYGFTDYLDGISEAADPTDDDWYFTVGLNLAYRIKKRSPYYW